MKAKSVILIIIVALVGGYRYFADRVPTLLTDLYDQKNIKTFESGSVTELPLGTVSTEGFENKAPGEWFGWVSDNPSETAGYPLPNEEDPTVRAKDQYDRYCLVCHGEGDETNTKGLAATKINEVGMTAPALASLTPHFNDLHIDRKIENGGTVMPRMGHIVARDKRVLIVFYLRSLEPDR